jgi:hypothetical protein
MVIGLDVKAYLASPVPTKKRIPKQRDKNKKVDEVDAMVCAHEYEVIPNHTDKDGKVVLNQSICPVPECRKPDFRRLQCKHCKRTQSDTGTCPGH